MTAIKLDYDRREPPRDLLSRLGLVRRWLNTGRFGPIVVTRTKRGYHVETSCTRTLDALSIVAVQAMLGSDWKRELYNLVRARGLASAPTFWRNRWNVLYARKLEDM